MQADVAVIGGGPGGYAAAIRCAQLGRKVALIEKEHLGGVCLNWGCIPSKALLHAANVLDTVQAAGTLGITVTDITIDFARTLAHSRTIVDRQTRGLEFLMRKNRIEVHTGTATFTDPHTVQITGPEGRPAQLQADTFIIATGGRPRALPGLPFDGTRILSSREALMQADLPDRAVIVGGGAIGVEFAYLWHTFGVAVTLVEYEERLLPLEDAEVSTELEKQFRGSGIRVLTGHTAQAYDVPSGTLQIASRPDAGGEIQSLPADLVLVAVGITPNTDDMNLDRIGIPRDDRGFIRVDDCLRTSQAHIFAAGDCTGRLPLAHVAIAQAVTAAETIADADPVPLGDEQYRFMPRCTYATPQVASMGYTEAEAQAAGLSYNVGTYPLFPNGKAKARGASKGFVKILAGSDYGEILGAHLIGDEVTELLPALSLAQMMELTPTEIARTVHAHPTLSEVVMEAAAAVEGVSLHM